MSKTVVFDFDGVIHSYTSGWKGAAVIPDPPVPGIKEAIAEIRAAGYRVVIVSSRCAGPGVDGDTEGMLAILRYLNKHEIEVDAIQSTKPPAIVYIDDRAICFDGDPSVLLGKIKNFRPWMKTT